MSGSHVCNIIEIFHPLDNPLRFGRIRTKEIEDLLIAEINHRE